MWEVNKSSTINLTHIIGFEWIPVWGSWIFCSGKNVSFQGNTKWTKQSIKLNSVKLILLRVGNKYLGPDLTLPETKQSVAKGNEWSCCEIFLRDITVSEGITLQPLEKASWRYFCFLFFFCHLSGQMVILFLPKENSLSPPAGGDKEQTSPERRQFFFCFLCSNARLISFFQNKSIGRKSWELTWISTIVDTRKECLGWWNVSGYSLSSLVITQFFFQKD